MADPRKIRIGTPLQQRINEALGPTNLPPKRYKALEDLLQELQDKCDQYAGVEPVLAAVKTLEREGAWVNNNIGDIVGAWRAYVMKQARIAAAPRL